LSNAGRPSFSPISGGEFGRFSFIIFILFYYFKNSTITPLLQSYYGTFNKFY
jgi:hypothetical protein